MPPTLERGRLLSHVPKVINIAKGDNGRLYTKVCHFSRPGAKLNAAASTALRPGGRQNGRVANEVCYTKRRTNTDEFARIT